MTKIFDILKKKKSPLTGSPLSILGLGLFLPPAGSVREMAKAVGVDTSQYEGYENACIAGAEDHPSTMAASALKSAMVKSRISPSQIRLVLSCGVSRDYLPSWSIANEVMRLLDFPSTSFGFDLMIGCLGTLTALDFAQAWLQANGGGYAAIVCSEKWSYTIDRRDPNAVPLWAYGDGGGALVVGMNVEDKSLATYKGAYFVTHTDLNGLVYLKYGGTRHPSVEGESLLSRQLKPVAKEYVIHSYRTGYGQAFEGLGERFHQPFSWLVCNQVSPNIVKMITHIAGVDENHVFATGVKTGHLGSVDSIAGLDQLFRRGPLNANVAIAASTPYAFGAGLLTP
jgi:3-oxoacyl-[acyl-carrier-protein] synthase III